MLTQDQNYSLFFFFWKITIKTLRGRDLKLLKLKISFLIILVNCCSLFCENVYYNWQLWSYMYIWQKLKGNFVWNSLQWLSLVILLLIHKQWSLEGETLLHQSSSCSPIIKIGEDKMIATFCWISCDNNIRHPFK